MPSNPAAVFTDQKPDGGDTGPTVVGHSQANLEALRNGQLMGQLNGWPLTRTFDVTNTDEVATETFSKSTERVKITYTWQDSGGDRRVASILYQYSSTSGADYVNIGTWTPTYSGASDHRITSEAWT